MHNIMCGLWVYAYYLVQFCGECVYCVCIVCVLCVCVGGGMVAWFGEQDNMMYMHAVFSPEYIVLDGILQTVCKVCCLSGEFGISTFPY